QLGDDRDAVRDRVAGGCCCVDVARGATAVDGALARSAGRHLRCWQRALCDLTAIESARGVRDRRVGYDWNAAGQLRRGESHSETIAVRRSTLMLTPGLQTRPGLHCQFFFFSSNRPKNAPAAWERSPPLRKINLT